MKKLIIKILVLSTAVFFAGCVLHQFFPFVGLPPQEDYMAAIIDKHNRLNSTESPRIILVGGSNLAFGIDSKMMEDSLGIPVVNMGLHAGLGIAFMLNEVKSEVARGDIIVLSPEYYLGKGDYNLLQHTVDIYPPAKEYVHADLLEHITGKYSIFLDNLSRDVDQIQDGLVYFKNNQMVVSFAPDSFIYRRNVFSQYCDIVAHLNMTQPLRIDLNPIEEVDYQQFLDLLNDFVWYIESKGARVYFVYPPYIETCSETDKILIKKFDLVLRANLRAKILCSPEFFAFSESDFFNTSYHLNANGRLQRTSRIIQLLKKLALVQ